MITPINDTLYEVICGWWKAYGFPVLPRDLLSKRGFISFVNSKPIVCGFLYKDETSSFGMLEWITINPDSSDDERFEAFNALMIHFKNLSKDIGIKFLISVSTNESLTSRLESSGFCLTKNTYLEHLFLKIGD